MRPFWSDDRGAALIASFLILLLLMILGSALLSISVTEHRIADNQYHSLQALYLADAGVQKAIAELLWNAEFRGAIPEFPLGDGNVSVTVSDGAEPEKVQIISVGSVGDYSRTVVVELELQYSLLLFEEILRAFGDFGTNYIGQDAQVNGQILSNQDLTIDKKSSIYGNITVNGVLGLGNQVTIDGLIQEQAGVDIPGTLEVDWPQCPLPVDAEDWYLPAGLGEPQEIDGDVSEAEAFTGGNYFLVNGDVHLGQNVELTDVTIVTTGNIVIGQKSILHGVTLVAGGNVNIDQEGELQDVTLVAGGNVSLGKKILRFSGNVYGQGGVSIDRELKTDGASIIVSGGQLSLGQQAEFAGTLYAQGDITIERKLKVNRSSTIFAGGDLTLGQETQFQGHIYSTGATQIMQKFETTGPTSLFAQGPVTIGKDSQFMGTVFSEDHIDVGQHMSLTGSMVGGRFTIGQKSQLEYDIDDIVNSLPSGAGKIADILTWDAQ